jgi:hypothetical protein
MVAYGSSSRIAFSYRWRRTGSSTSFPCFSNVCNSVAFLAFNTEPEVEAWGGGFNRSSSGICGLGRSDGKGNDDLITKELESIDAGET